MSEATTFQPPSATHPLHPTSIDLLTIPNQIGHAILSPDGSIVRREGQLSEQDVVILYRIMLEVGTAAEGEGVRRVTVGFGGVSYVLGVGGDGCLYVVKKKSSS
jgi:hypothetical protein